MPVKFGSKLPQETEARIEIIPLIDIMFFLLASFMLVSLSMVNLKSVKVNLPTASTAGADARRNFVDVSVAKSGAIFFNKEAVGPNELGRLLSACRQTNGSVRILISGDKDARHGDVIRALDVVRAAGIENVAFEIRESSSSAR
jgi:biopolymer transport protein ExbD